MKIQTFKIIFQVLLFTIILFTYFPLSANISNKKGLIIEDFNDGQINLTSFPEEDIHPASWELNSSNTYHSSAFSLRLFGNTWKVQNIDTHTVVENEIWQVAAYIAEEGEIQGIAFIDSHDRILNYAFAGTTELTPENWQPIYQGAFAQNQWNQYLLPVADDWYAKFGYLPEITFIVYINDRDEDYNAIIYFDEIIVVSDDLPKEPQVTITYETGKTYKNKNGHKSVDVDFSCIVLDPDSEIHNFFWDFGDGTSSTDSTITHTFNIEDDHQYTILLKVTDDSGKTGFASCKINVDEGESSFPLTMNFTGDIILARGYEYPGGIIPTLGVEAIFEPTLSILGDAADITVANLECPLGTYGTPHPTKPVRFMGSPDNVDGLVYAGIDIVSLANNHIIDYGLEGLQQTQNVLQENNILFSGAGADSYEANLPVLYSKKGVNFAFIAMSDRTGQYNNYQPFLNAGYNKPGFADLTNQNLSTQIERIKNISDYIILELHSGNEYALAPDKTSNESIEDDFYNSFFRSPTKDEIDDRHFAVDAGADLVICHHPHIIQGFEVYKGKLIAHSLGNFIFDLSYPETFYSMILNTEIDESGFSKFTVTPIYIDDFIPVRATGELGIHILDYITSYSKDLNTILVVNEDSVTATIAMDTTALQPNIISKDADLTFTIDGGERKSQPVKLRTHGNISTINTITPSNGMQYRLGKELVFFGNFESEGCTLWEMNNGYEWFDETETYEGLRSLCQERPYGHSGIITNLEKRIKCYNPTGTFSIHGYIKSNNSRNATLQVQHFSSRTGGYALATNIIDSPVNGTNDWEFYHKEFTPPAGGKYFDVRIRSEAPASGTGYTYYDNVGIIEWSEWKTFTGNEQIKAPNDYYWLQVKNTNSISSALINFDELTYSQPVTSIENSSNISNEFRLKQNYPNPFNPSTTIEYILPKNGKISIIIYNILGQKVKTLFSGFQQKGNKSITWNGTNNEGLQVSSGIYFYSIKIKNQIKSKKMVLLR